MLAAQPKLLSVNMSNNLISEIQPGAFANMTRLVRLILSKNKIQQLDSASLSGERTTMKEMFTDMSHGAGGAEAGLEPAQEKLLRAEKTRH